MRLPVHPELAHGLSASEQRPHNCLEEGRDNSLGGKALHVGPPAHLAAGGALHTLGQPQAKALVDARRDAAHALHLPYAAVHAAQHLDGIAQLTCRPTSGMEAGGGLDERKKCRKLTVGTRRPSAWQGALTRMHRATGCISYENRCPASGRQLTAAAGLTSTKQLASQCVR